MRTLFTILSGLLFFNITLGQTLSSPAQTKIMTLGVFHFAYPNLDAVKTELKDQISVLDEPFQSEIIAISKAISEFKPSIIAIELTPDQQSLIDSLYSQYRAEKFELKKNEAFQLGFRTGHKLNLEKIYCVDDRGNHYNNIETIFADRERMQKFEDYFLNYKDTIFSLPNQQNKVSSIIETLTELNQPHRIKESLATYLLHPFKYEEQAGDFTGVDFETGRWFNRNLRIFRNIQRIPHNSEDRILLIIGSGHLNLLNHFFETSREFELVSPLPFLDSAKKHMK